MSYYTGIVFEVYADNVGFPIANGGRYNFLLQKFGKEAGATGFAIRLDRLLEAVGKIERESLLIVFYSVRKVEKKPSNWLEKNEKRESKWSFRISMVLKILMHAQNSMKMLSY